MKLPSKNQNGLFICEECGRTYLRIFKRRK